MTIWTELFLVFASLVVYAFFSLVETSILTVRKSRIRELIEDKKTTDKLRRKAECVLQLKSQPEEFLAAMQTGSAFSVILAATFGSVIALEEVHSFVGTTFQVTQTAAMILAIIIMSVLLLPLLLVFGGLIPKSIALHQNVRYSLFFSEFVLLLLTITRPLTTLPVVLANMVLRPFKDKASFVESRISEEEFRVMLEEGARTGVLDKTENELLENILDFRETTVREVMIPRTKVVAIDIDSPREKVINRLIAEGYTRLPVYRNTLDEIVGVVYSKDVLALIEHPNLIVLEDIIRPVLFVPETKLISGLLRELQAGKFHLAVVVDEFGGTAGIVTLEDILEEIVGEIEDEYDEALEQPQFDPSSQQLRIPAHLNISAANEHLRNHFDGFAIPETDEYESVGGYVNLLFGHIPEIGEHMVTQNVEVTVLKRTPKEVLQAGFREVKTSAADETKEREHV